MILQLYSQCWIAAAILAAANLRIAESLGDAPLHANTIAERVRAERECVFRLLRALASVGVFREVEPKVFAHTPMSRSLRSDSPANAGARIRMMGLRSVRQAMAEYEYAIATGESAFELAHGCGSFEVIARRPDESQIYHDGMALDGPLVTALLDRFDFCTVTRLVDVGGGKGTLLARVLQKNPHQQGVLFELPGVVSRDVLVEHGVSSRSDICAGDMYTDPLPAGDGYVLKNVLHGWHDDQCVQLLRRIREHALEGVRIFIIENVMPEGNEPAPCKLFDLFLLLGGHRSRVRTKDEFQSLLDSAGFEIAQVVPIVENQCVIEARLMTEP